MSLPAYVETRGTWLEFGVEHRPACPHTVEDIELLLAPATSSALVARNHVEEVYDRVIGVVDPWFARAGRWLAARLGLDPASPVILDHVGHRTKDLCCEYCLLRIRSPEIRAIAALTARSALSDLGYTVGDRFD